jgi:hypothetical protein
MIFLLIESWIWLFRCCHFLSINCVYCLTLVYVSDKNKKTAFYLIFNICWRFTSSTFCPSHLLTITLAEVSSYFMFCPRQHFFHSMPFPVDIIPYSVFCPHRSFSLRPSVPVRIFPFDFRSYSALIDSMFSPLTFFTFNVFYFDVLAVNRNDLPNLWYILNLLRSG